MGKKSKRKQGVGWEKINPKRKSINSQQAMCYNNRQMELKNFIKTTAFILIAIGTAGLLLNEFVWEHSSTRTIIFAVFNLVGLAKLAFAHFGMRSKSP